jgi:hypothetical protein
MMQAFGARSVTGGSGWAFQLTGHERMAGRKRRILRGKYVIMALELDIGGSGRGGSSESYERPPGFILDRSAPYIFAQRTTVLGVSRKEAGCTGVVQIATRQPIDDQAVAMDRCCDVDLRGDWDDFSRMSSVVYSTVDGCKIQYSLDGVPASYVLHPDTVE